MREAKTVFPGENVKNPSQNYRLAAKRDRLLGKFDRLLRGDIGTLPESAIRSGGFVIDTLEAAFWCFLATDCYRDTVLKAVNLGDDTDTTAAVAGAVAGLYYGRDAIPADWLQKLAGADTICRWGLASNVLTRATLPCLGCRSLPGSQKPPCPYYTLCNAITNGLPLNPSKSRF
jgi:hypothetical protein